jgi:hypothetical protein
MGAFRLPQLLVTFAERDESPTEDAGGSEQIAIS